MDSYMTSTQLSEYQNKRIEHKAKTDKEIRFFCNALVLSNDVILCTMFPQVGSPWNSGTWSHLHIIQRAIHHCLGKDFHINITDLAIQQRELKADANQLIVTIKGRTQCRELPLCAGSGEGCQWQALPSPVQCEETATRTWDLPVTGGKTLPLAPGPPFSLNLIMI